VRCYNHSDRDASGICRACGKGLCTECTVDLGYGLSCRGDHEKRVAANEALIARAAQVQDTAGRVRFGAPVFFGFMGLIFVGYALMQPAADTFLALLGSGFLIFAAFLFVVSRRAYQTKKADA
jgi:hypothetical protein